MTGKSTIIRIRKLDKILWPAAAAACTILWIGFVVSYGGEVWIFIWLLFPAMLLYTSFTSWIFRVSFGESKFSVRPFLYPGYASCRYSYAEIQRIERGSRKYALRILDSQGGSYELACGPLEGGWTRVIDEFERRLPPEKIEAGIRQPLARNKWLDGLRAALWSLIVFGYATYFLATINRQYLLLPTGWNRGDYSANRFEVETVRIDSQGDPWLLSWQSYDKNLWQLRHLTGQKTETWDMPGLSIDDRLNFGMMQDAQNEPWLIFENRLLHREGGQWEEYPIPEGADWYSPSDGPLTRPDSILWRMSQSKDHLLRFDLGAAPPKATKLPLPDSAVSGGYSFERLFEASENKLIALFDGKTDVKFFRYRDNGWEELTAIQKEAPSYSYIRDSTLDSKGNIWILLRTGIAEKTVGRYDPEDNSWIWFVTPLATASGEIYEFTSILIDARGRLWLVEKYFGMQPKSDNLVVFEMDTAGAWKEIRRYTKNNSGFQSMAIASNPQAPDGRIWTWDRQLYWIRGDADELPYPLPDWLAFLNSSEGGLWILVGITILIVFILVLQYGARKLDDKKNETPRGKPRGIADRNLQELPGKPRGIHHPAKADKKVQQGV
jgi:hypothetical protein